MRDARNETDKFPSVLNLPWRVTVFDNSEMVKGMSERQYNNCIATFGGEFLMTYRIHGYDRGRSEVALAHLDPENGFKIKKTYVVTGLPCPRGTEHLEDARLFEHDGRLWVTYTEVRDYNDKPWRCSQRLVILKQVDGKWVGDQEVKIKYGKNDQAQEKNWQFFSLKGKLYFVYGIKNHKVCHLDLGTGTVVQEYETPGIKNWPYGSLSGGTPPLLIGDRFISFFHSYVPHAYRCRRYSMSAYEFRAEAPFDILRVSQKPLAYGSAKDGYADDPRFNGWQPLVTFPSGLVFHDGYVVSVGINDHVSTLFYMPPGLVSKGMGPTEFPIRVGPRKFKTKNFNCPVRVHGQGMNKPRFYSWTKTGDNGEGVMVATCPFLINALENLPFVDEILP
jgi:predicted GH43/DUF377 family glycosyl hydrolase